MTTHQLTPHAGVLVALDIAKTRNEVLLEIPGQRRRRRLTLLNTRAEHDRLIELLLGLGQPVTCGFEATGNYHRPIAWRLIQAGFEVRLISSLALARTREALHNSWDKNDPKDAQVILHMLRIGASQHYHDPLAVGINKLTLRAGDVVVVTMPEPMAGYDLARVERHVRERLPAGVFVLVRDSGVGLTVLRDGRPVEPEVDAPVSVEVPRG